MGSGGEDKNPETIVKYLESCYLCPFVCPRAPSEARTNLVYEGCGLGNADPSYGCSQPALQE
eukprot:5024103-Pyramimonas_sp.AAC.1